MKRPTSVAVLLLLVLPAIGAATDRAVRAEADRLFREGVGLLRERQYNPALTSFERTIAYRAWSSALWNAAMCHLYLGHRDMSLWFLDRYLMRDQDARASAEVQAAVTDVAGESTTIPLERRGPLADALYAATELASEGEATAADRSRQLYGSENSSPGASSRAGFASGYGTSLFQIGFEQATQGNWEASLELFERSAAYTRLRNAAYNIGASHLHLGRRDLAVHFYRLYIGSVPELERDGAVQAAIRAIEGSSPQIDDQAQRDALVAQLDRAVEHTFDPTTRADRPPSTPP